MSNLTERERFFYDHAGWSHGPDETSEDGRVRCARELAMAEEEMTRRGWTIDVEDDPDVMEDDAGTVEEVAAGNWLNLLVVLRDERGDILTCLGGVTVFASEGYAAPYVHVCGVEMAEEVIDQEKRERWAAACRWASLPEWVQHAVLIRGDDWETYPPKRREGVNA